jgi:hypothetical protein
VSLERLIEEQIRRAMAEGQFDNLQGKGQPIDLNGYFQTPEHLRICYSILKNADFVPEEIQLLKDIEALRTQLDACSDEAQRSRLNKTITEKTLSFNLLMEKHRRTK